MPRRSSCLALLVTLACTSGPAIDSDKPDTDTVDSEVPVDSDTEVVSDTEMPVDSDTDTDEVPPVGVEDWLLAFGGSGHEEIKGVAADSEGNVYLAGMYRDTLVIGTETLQPVEPGANQPDVFVASFDPSGTFRWAHGFGAVGEDGAHEITVGDDDRIYVLGVHKADLTVGSEVLTSHGSTDPFLVVYDADGAQLWARNWGGEFGETPRDMDVSDDGTIWITGSFTGAMTADDHHISATSEFGGLSDIFVMAVDGATRTAVGLRGFTGLGHDVGTAIAADTDGSVVIAVSYQEDLEVSPGVSFHSGGQNFDAGLIRLNTDGELDWAEAYGGPDGDELLGLDLDSDGQPYVAGVFGSAASFGGASLAGVGGLDIVVAAYTHDGAHRWSQAVSGGSFDLALDLEVAGDGVYVTGRFKEDLTVGTLPLAALGENYDALVARFATADGTAHWAASVGSVGEDMGAGIAVGGDGSVYVGGFVTGDVDFAAASHTPPGAGLDGFVVRWTEQPSL